MTPESLFIAGVGSYVPPTFSAADAAARGWYDAESLRTDGWLSAAVAGDLSPAEMALTQVCQYPLGFRGWRSANPHEC